MKKVLNIEGITNELEGASAFFKKPASPPPEQQSEPPKQEIVSNPLSDSPFFEKTNTTLSQVQNNNDQDQKRTFERSNERPLERTTERTIKKARDKIRHTFDIYRDQLIALQGIQFEKVKAGKKKPKLGKMVSDGIDLYLKQWASKHKQG
jgi:hypothetical protein